MTFNCPRTWTYVVGLSLLAGQAYGGSSDVLTSRYDLERTGAALHERLLTPASIDRNLDPDNFGKLFTYDLAAISGQPDGVGEIYAQPLYVVGPAKPLRPA